MVSSLRCQILRVFFVVMLLLGCMALLQACSSRPSLVGSWTSEAPASLQFEFRSNGSVWLLTASPPRQIWRYELTGTDTLILYDGIGRRREYLFSIQGDHLTFLDEATGAVVEQYSRSKP